MTIQFDTLSSAASSTVVNPTREATEGVFQVEISATATAKLQGRTSSLAAWVDIDTWTASGAKIVALFPDMRVTVSSYGSGTIKSWLSEPDPE
jgi:hypothetical protein